ncbi:MAG TPA: hypothetical protein VF278_09390 [Pirellulales bacterium]
MVQNHAVDQLDRRAIGKNAIGEHAMKFIDGKTQRGRSAAGNNVVQYREAHRQVLEARFQNESLSPNRIVGRAAGPSDAKDGPAGRPAVAPV